MEYLRLTAAFFYLAVSGKFQSKSTNRGGRTSGTLGSWMTGLYSESRSVLAVVAETLSSLTGNCHSDCCQEHLLAATSLSKRREDGVRLAQLPESGLSVPRAPLHSGPGGGHFIWMLLGSEIHWQCARVRKLEWTSE